MGYAVHDIIGNNEQCLTEYDPEVLQSAEERTRFRHAPRFAPAGQSTQMIVGATDESDRDILLLSSALYGRPR